jgi:hypothetical protein
MTFRQVATFFAALLTVASGCVASGTEAASSPGQPVRPVTTDSNGPTHTAGGRVTHAGKAAFLRVRLKMPKRQVEALLGDPPFRLQSTPQELCWLYGRRRDDLSGGTVCFVHGRVSFVATPERARVGFTVTTARPVRRGVPTDEPLDCTIVRRTPGVRPRTPFGA